MGVDIRPEYAPPRSNPAWDLALAQHTANEAANAEPEVIRAGAAHVERVAAGGCGVVDRAKRSEAMCGYRNCATCSDNPAARR